MTFPEWFTELKNNPIWWDSIQLRYGKKDLPGIANDCYIWLLTQPQRLARKDFNDFRVAYQKFLMYAKDKEDVQKLPEAEPVVIHPQALTGEARLRKLQEFERLLKSMPALKPVGGLTAKERAENTGWRIPEEPKYPATTIQEAYIRNRHLEYVKANYEPNTGVKLSTWIEEEEFNRLYDENLIP